MADQPFNVASLTLSAVALIALFETCVKGCDFVATAKATGERSQQILSRIDIDRRRLMIWGRRWGLEPDAHNTSRLEHDLNVADTRQIVHDALTSIELTVCDIEKLQDKYSLDVSDLSPRDAADTLPNTFHDNVRSEPGLGHSKATWQERIAQRQAKLKIYSKMAYSFKDESRLLNLSNDLSWFVDRLWEQLMSEKLLGIERCLASEVLSRATSEQQLRSFGNASQGSLSTIQRHAENQLLAQDMERVAVGGHADIYRLEKKVHRQLLLIESTAERACTRCVAQFLEERVVQPGQVKQRRPVPVFLEYKRGNWDSQVATQMEKRVDNLTTMLGRVKSAAEAESFRVMDCMGYFEHYAPNTFGIFYRLPANACPTEQAVYLDELLSTESQLLKRMPSLDCRIRLAKLLTISLHEFHSSGWLHKQISSSNVVFFKHVAGEEILEEHLLSPYLVGFGISRPSNDPRGTEDKTLAEQPVDLYRHPSQLTSPSRREHDMYSLGLLLLEIARWNRLEGLIEEKGQSQRLFHEEVLSYAEDIDFDVGKTYCEVVKTLLKGVEGGEWSAPRSLFADPPTTSSGDFSTQQQSTLRDFYYSAVAKLESISMG